MLVWSPKQKAADHNAHILMHPPINTMVGAKSSATLKSSRTNLGPSPRYFCMSSEPTTRRKVADVLLATALASRVFPVPGSPYRMTPWGREGGIRHHKSLLCRQSSLKGGQYMYFICSQTTLVPQMQHSDLQPFRCM